MDLSGHLEGPPLLPSHSPLCVFGVRQNQDLLLFTFLKDEGLLVT